MHYIIKGESGVCGGHVAGMSAREGKQLCEPAVGDATVGGGLLRAVPLDKPFLLSTLRVVATLVHIKSDGM